MVQGGYWYKSNGHGLWAISSPYFTIDSSDKIAGIVEIK